MTVTDRARTHTHSLFALGVRTLPAEQAFDFHTKPRSIAGIRKHTLGLMVPAVFRNVPAYRTLDARTGMRSELNESNLRRIVRR